MKTKRPISSPHLPRNSGGILGRAKQTVINGGNFTSVVSTAKARADGFESLQKHVATSAFHNSAHRVDPPRCHESTRQAVLQEIFNWMVLHDAIRNAWMLWLNGAAGAGKSAICQSVAEMCIAQGILVASFFFFRTDPTRNTVRPLVATLAYQIIQLVPELKDAIIGAVETNPLIFEQSLDTQFDELIIKPLRWLQFSGSTFKIRIIIDGIDECVGHENQLNIIHTIAKFLSRKDSPIIVLFGSRAERQIQTTFRSPHVANNAIQLPLDDHYLSSSDIRVFVRDKFAEIKASHYFCFLLDDDWPPLEYVREIVQKSSGQFIYASAVMKFISDPRSHPAMQLEIIHGIRSIGSSVPFAQLDVLYQHILSQVADIETISALLVYIIIGQSTDTADIALFFDMLEADIHIALADPTSVIACEDGQIRFLHASLPDFLLDQARSDIYYIDPAVWSTRLSIFWYRNAGSGRFKERNHVSVLNLLEHAQGTSDLREHILTFNPYRHSQSFVRFFTDYLSAIQKLDFNDGGTVYLHQLNVVTRCVRKLQLELPILRRTHEVSQILAEIEREEAEDQQQKNLMGHSDQKGEVNQKRLSRRSRIMSWTKILP